MHAELALASIAGTAPGPVLMVLGLGAMVLAGLYSLVGLAVTAEINTTLKAIHQSDTPAR